MNEYNIIKIQKHSKNIEKIISSSIFFDDSYFIYVFKKAERISAAIHMVTNYFGEDESLRHVLRVSGLALVSHSINISLHSTFEKKTTLKAMSRTLLEINSVLEISFIAGMVSEMNHAILRSEIDNLLEVVVSLEKSAQAPNDVVLSDHFFGVFDRGNRKEEEEKNPLKAGVDFVKTEVDKDLKVPEDKTESKIVDHKGHVELNDKKEIRKNIILSLLKRKNTLTIKDITAVIHDCSGKTIQRELQGLIDQNVLKKEGERRWTRYLLAN